MEASQPKRVSFLTRIIISLLICLLSAGCLRSDNSTNQASNRPACVSLDSYTAVISQVMGIAPEWELVDVNGNEYQWVSQDDQSENTLTAILSSEGCVCATNVESVQKGTLNKSELGGLFMGAAVAPVSDLNYTSDWLEPKILLGCLPSLILHHTYEEEKQFNDGTTWRLTCSKISGLGKALYTLTILTPQCMNVFQ